LRKSTPIKGLNWQPSEMRTAMHTPLPKWVMAALLIFSHPRARMLESEPALRASNLKGLVPFRQPADAGRYVEGLRKAGLPE